MSNRLNNRDLNINPNYRDYHFCHNRAALVSGSDLVGPLSLLVHSELKDGLVFPSLRQVQRQAVALHNEATIKDI